MKGPRVRELNAGADPTIPGFGFTSVAFGSALLTLLRFSDITEVYPQGLTPGTGYKVSGRSSGSGS